MVSKMSQEEEHNECSLVLQSKCSAGWRRMMPVVMVLAYSKLLHTHLHMAVSGWSIVTAYTPPLPARGGLKEKHLRRLGVRDEVCCSCLVLSLGTWPQLCQTIRASPLLIPKASQVALVVHSLDTDNVVKALWKLCRRLEIKRFVRS